MKKNNKTKQNRESRKNVYLLIAGMAIVVILAVICVVLSLRPTEFEIAKEKCGENPVIASSFAASWSYDLPGDKYYNPRGGMGIEFFCSESEAQAAGYRHSPLNNTDTQTK